MTRGGQADSIEIGLLLYPQAQLAAIHGMTDLFSVANGMANERDGEASPRLCVSHWRPDAQGRMVRVFESDPGLSGTPAIVIAPPSLDDPIAPAAAAAIAAWLAHCHAEGAVLCSVCAGAFLLAETGLLSGRTATTHWNYAETLGRRFPDIRIDVDRLVIDDGDILTAGGVMAWVDLGLTLIERLMGPAIMLATSRLFVVDPPRREQRSYSAFLPRLDHGDAAILKVQHWLQGGNAFDASLTAMAECAGLHSRTFLRRFSAATGLKPVEYCQSLKVAKARELLELTRDTIDQIAWSVGYDDPGAFRKIFQRKTGLSPGDYRRRFSVSAAA